MLGIKIDSKTPLSVLCLGAHCDDIEIGAGGTLLKLIREYAISSVDWIVFASNEKRKAEAERSADRFLEPVVNKRIVIRSWRDGFLPFSAWDVKDYFELLKTDIAPDLIFTHYRDDRHQDHRIISELTWNTWRNHFILEYEIPKYDGDLGAPSFFVPLESEYIDRRNQIILDEYVSQRGKHWFDDETFRSINRLRGMESASLYAEAFYSRKICLK
ncbi:PIG-L family deacetylase [uncultured Desulfosarcina sp.]|uniref:PIG-L deacetylase family protein n=1 Tax=uncultured Desulfosarcina sp. TaxID=218289 RepID=UPI0029C8CFF3|nr:PIG-L family deacetylase [uncultured Desulfosarcina sp.]